MEADTPDDILGQDAWLRRIARAIVRDPAVADDIAQDAWVAALRQGRMAASDRPWIVGVVFHSWRSRFRREGNARAREQDSASQGEGPSTAEVVEQIELRRRVAEGLLALDEPFRTTLHLRFMLGDSLRDVAKKTGVAASTAKDRCDRGLLQLRRDLESGVGESGEPSRDWLQALVVAAALPQAGAKLGGKAVATAVCLLVCGAAWVGGWNAVQRSGLTSGLATGAEGVAEVDEIVPQRTEETLGHGAELLAVVTDDEQQERQAAGVVARGAMTPTPVGAFQGDRQPADGSEEITIIASVRHPSGSPSSGSWSLLAWPQTSTGLSTEEAAMLRSRRSGTLDLSGCLEVRFRRQVGVQYALSVESPSGVERRWRWDADELEPFMDLGEVVFATTARLIGRLRMPNGDAPPSSELWLLTPEWGRRGSRGTTGRGAPVVADPATGLFAFESLPIGVAKIRVAGMKFGPVGSYGVTISHGDPDPLEIVLEEVAEQLSAIHVTLHWASGTPRTRGGVGAEALHLVDADGQRWPAAAVARRTDRYFFPGAPVGESSVCLEDERCRSVRKDGVQPGERLHFRLAGSASVRPRVLDAEGHELVDYRLEVMEVTDPQHTRDRNILLEEGASLDGGVYGGLLPGRYRFYAQAGDAVGAAEVLTLAPNELVPVEIVVRPLPSVSGVVRRPDGSAVNAATVRLVRPAEARDRAQTRVLVPGSSTSDPGTVRWQVATTSTDATGAFELEAPESGRYLVIVGDPLTTGVESLPFEVSSNNAPDRLSLTIAEGGIIQGTVHVPGVESLVGWQVKLARSSQVLGIRRGANPAACQVDADGRFTLGPLQAGETKVYLVEPERLNDSAIYRTSQGHTEALGVVNVQNGITSTVEFTAPGPPLATVRSHLTVQQDPHLWHRVTLVPVAAPDWAQNHARSGDAGSIGPIYARPGEYYVRVQSPSWAWQRPATITVTEGQTIDLELRIELERRVVRLRNLDGSPSDGHIMVRRLPVDGESRGTTVTTVLPDENGDFEIGLSAGTYEFSDPIQETAVRERWPIVEGQITLVLRPAGG